MSTLKSLLYGLPGVKVFTSWYATLPGKSFIWKNIHLQGVWWWQIVAPFLFVALVDLIQPLKMAVVLLVSMYLHEMGHGFVFALAKIKYKIMILFPFGAVAAPNNEVEDKRSDELPWSTLGWLMLAGPAVNVILAAVGFVLRDVDGELLRQWGEAIFVLNTVLALSNLMPFWKFDGGQFAFVVYSSLSRRGDRVFTLITTAFAAVAMYLLATTPGFNEWQRVLGNLLVNYNYTLFFAVFIGGLWWKQHIDDDTIFTSPQAMGRGQMAALLTFYFSLVIATMWMISNPLTWIMG